MRNEIYWIVTATLRPEDYEEFKEVVTSLVEATRQEQGSIAYDYSIDPDHTRVQILETYSDSPAVVTHVHDTFSQFAEDFGRLVTIDGFVVYGWPDDAARKILDGFGSTYMTPFAGFTASSEN